MSHGTPIPRFRHPHLLRELRCHPTRVFLRVMETCGPIAQVSFGLKRLYILTDPELAYHVLRYEPCFPRPWSQVERAITALMGARVVTSFNGPLHHRRRQALVPAFTQTRVRSYAPTMVKYARAMCASWKDQQVLDLCEELTRLTLSIAFQVFLSTELLDEDLDVVAVTSAYADYLADRATRLWWVPFWLPTPLNLSARRARRALTRQVSRVVEQRLTSGAARDDVLDLVLAAHRKGVFDQQQVVAELVNLLTSFLPSTASIQATLVELLTEPGQVTYQRLLREAEQFTLDHPYTEQDHQHLASFRAAYQEVQRERPFVPALLRKARGPQTLPGDYDIPARSLVLVAIHALHHRAEAFSDPDTFCPERFVAAAPASPPQGGYLAFGAGVHTCLGNHYSELLGPLVLATLCRLVRFEVAPDQGPVPPEVLGSVLQRHPFKVQVQHRGLPGAAEGKPFVQTESLVSARKRGIYA